MTQPGMDDSATTHKVFGDEPEALEAIAAASQHPNLVIMQMTAQETTEEIFPLAYQKNASVTYCSKANRLISTGDDGVAKPPDPREIKHLELGIFFDGTRNNMVAPQASLSNVARMFGLYRDEVQGDTYRTSLYIRGVGSLDVHTLDAIKEKKITDALARSRKRINEITSLFATRAREAAYEVERREIAQIGRAHDAKTRAAEGFNNLGGMFGFGATHRIRLAEQWIVRLCGLHPQAVDVKIDCFGFSRGAATARSFTRGFHQWGKVKCSGKDITARFLGLWDTVATFETVVTGLKTASTDLMGEHNLYLAGDAVAGTHIYHIVARDEFRGNFRYVPAGTGHEIFVTGAHADIGGGYEDNEHRRSTDIAAYCLKRMHHAAAASGVPLKPLVMNGNLRKLESEEMFFQKSVSDRTRIWNFCYRDNVDKVYPVRSYKNFADSELLQDAVALSEGFSVSPKDNRTIVRNFDFWRQHIHISYYFVGASLSKEYIDPVADEKRKAKNYNKDRDPDAKDYASMRMDDLGPDWTRNFVDAFDKPPSDIEYVWLQPKSKVSSRFDPRLQDPYSRSQANMASGRREETSIPTYDDKADADRLKSHPLKPSEAWPDMTLDVWPPINNTSKPK